MNALSGLSGFDPSAFQQKIQDRFSSADTNQDGSLSVDEATALAESSGRNAENVDKMFNKFDSNGDGQLSGDEQSQMFEQLQARKEKLQELLNQSTQQGEGGQFAQLLESLQSDDSNDDEDSPQDVNQLLGENKTSEETLNYLAQKLPPIDTFA